MKSGRSQFVVQSGLRISSTFEYENICVSLARRCPTCGMIHGSRVEDNTFILACEASDAGAREVMDAASNTCARSETDLRRRVGVCAACCAIFRPGLDAPHQQEDDYDQEQKAEAAARVVSPAATVGPCRRCAYEQNYQDDEQDETDTHVAPPLTFNCCSSPLTELV